MACNVLRGLQERESGRYMVPARTGLPVADVRALAQDAVHPIAIFCGVCGRGVFESQDGGASWVPVANQSGLSNLNVRSLAVDGGARTIYAGTENGVAALTNFPVVGADAGAENSVAALTNFPVVGADPGAAPELHLSVWPTPAQGGALTVRFGLARRGPVSVDVFDVSGARARTLARAADEAAGAHTLTWEGRDDRGVALPPGLYFVRLVTSEGARIARVVRLGK